MPRDIYSTGRTDVVVASAARTTSGNSGALSNYGGVGKLRCQLDVTEASGVGQSLAVLVEDTLDGTNFFTVGTFASTTAAGREAINVTTPFTDTLRVSWTVTGATPSFTFSVSIYSEA